MKKRKRGGKHTISISFIVTFAILAGVYVAFYVSVFTPSVNVQHLPQNVPSYSSFWARYVPANAVQFGFQNYTKIRLLNSSYPFQNTLLDLTRPADVIVTGDVDYFLTTVFSQPNITLDIAFLNPQSYLNFRAPLEQVAAGEEVGNATLYNVAVTASGQESSGWLVLIPQDGAVGFAAGSSDAKLAVELALASAADPSQSVLSRSDVTRAIYIVGGIADHVALGLENFPGVAKGGLMTVTSVDSSGPYLYVKNVVAFANSSAAMSHYSDVRQGYLGAQKLVVYDSFVLAQEQDPLSKLGADYRLVL